MPYDAPTLISSINANSHGSHDGKCIAEYMERFKIKPDKDWTTRQSALHIYKLIQKGRIYDNLLPWWKEYTGEAYTPLIDRKPSVIYNLPKIIVDDSVAMLFGEEHFPTVRCDDEKTTEYLQYVTRDCGLRYSMLAAAREGAIGSVCVIVKVLQCKFYFDVLSTITLEPIFDATCPNTLVKLIDRKKILGEVLATRGYQIGEKDLKKYFWLQREWNDQSEIYYLPFLVDDESPQLMRDEERSSDHGLGFVPAVWIKNSPDANHLDGMCTFEPAIDTSIELNYQLSQLGRLLRYNSDPTMVIKNPSALEGQQLIKGSGVLQLDEQGDAYMVEMNGGGAIAVLEYARALREFALESVRGNRANPDKLGAIHSGKALQMLNAPLISFVDELRLCYGDFGLLKIYMMVLQVEASGKVEINYGKYRPGDADISKQTMRLEWPAWYAPTPQDDLQEAQTLQTYVATGMLSKETALKNIADQFGVVDEKKELTAINNDDKDVADMQKKTAKANGFAVGQKSGGTTKPKGVVRQQERK